jgi:hypothetical protein
MENPRVRVPTGHEGPHDPHRPDPAACPSSVHGIDVEGQRSGVGRTALRMYTTREAAQAMAKAK